MKALKKCCVGFLLGLIFIAPAQALLAADVETVPKSLPFQDVAKEAWYYEGVATLYDIKVVNGIDATHFAPQKEVTRAMAVTTLWRLHGSPRVAAGLSEPAFKDVDRQAYYADAVYWARNEGIVTGLSKESFAPFETISRADLAVMLMRFAEMRSGQHYGESGDLSQFADSDQIRPYAYKAMQWAVAKEILTGVEQAQLLPNGEVSRAQLSVLLTRYLKTERA